MALKPETNAPKSYEFRSGTPAARFEIARRIFFFPELDLGNYYSREGDASLSNIDTLQGSIAHMFTDMKIAIEPLSKNTVEGGPSV